jgi:hypothetical protein
MMAARVERQGRSARFAVRTLTPVPRFTDLARLKELEKDRADKNVAAGAVVATAAVDPPSWSLVRYQAWPEARKVRDPDDDGAQFYEVQHVSAPAHLREDGPWKRSS